jgi:hypothetical protein
MLIDAADRELVEFCIGESVCFRFPSNTWNGDPKEYIGSVVDTARSDRTGLKVKVVVYDESSPKNVWYTHLHVSTPSRKASTAPVTLRDLLTSSYPNASCLWDMTDRITKTNPPLRTIIKDRKHSASYLLRPNTQATGISPLLCYTAISMLFTQASDQNVQLDLLQGILPNEPRSYKDERRRPDRHKWQEAREREIQTLEKNNTWIYEDAPTDRVINPLPSQWVYKKKINSSGDIKYKARLVLRGDLQFDHEFKDTYSPTARVTSTRTLIALATQQGLSLRSFDVEAAFVSADVDCEIYIQPPPGHSFPPGKVARLQRSLYGLRQASALYWNKMHNFLTAYGFVQVSDEGTLFRLQTGNDVLYVSMYVDDGLVAFSSDQMYQRFLTALRTEFTLSSEGPLKDYLGIAIHYDNERGTTFLEQSKYVRDLLTKYNMINSSPVDTPVAPGTYFTGADCCDRADPAMKEAIKDYQSLIGALLWLSISTRPDIAFATNQLARFLVNPGPSHFVAAKRVLRYLAGTSTFGIRYHRCTENANTLVAYVDADFAGNPEDRLSVTGFIVFLNGGPISWLSKRQPVVSVSSTEAEFYAASIAGLELLFYRRLMEQLGFPQQHPTTVFEDNAACIFLSKRSGQINRAKHIDTRVFRLRELVRSGVLELSKVSTKDQVADLFTKALPAQSFAQFRSSFLTSP